MDKRIQAIAKQLSSKKNERMIIGISGPGASGKTTFAKQLMAALDFEVNYLNTDPYIITDVRKYTRIEYAYEGQKQAYKMTACHPAAHNLLALRRDIEMMREGIDFKTIETHYSKSTQLTSDKTISIVEGMSVAFLDLDLFDSTIYLHVDGDTELERRLMRDVSERGRSAKHLRNSHVQRRMQYELFMHPLSKKFDLVIESSNREVNN